MANAPRNSPKANVPAPVAGGGSVTTESVGTYLLGNEAPNLYGFDPLESVLRQE